MGNPQTEAHSFCGFLFFRSLAVEYYPYIDYNELEWAYTMKDMKTVIIAVLCGVIAGLALILKKQQDIQMVLALSHRELESWLDEGKRVK